MKYTTYTIEYPMEKGLTKADYLELHGGDIFYALTRWDTTTDEALDQMRRAYGRTVVNHWAKTHEEIIGGKFYA